LTNDFATRNQPLFFFNLKPSVVAVFEGLQPKDFVVYYEENDLDMLIKSMKKHFFLQNHCLLNCVIPQGGSRQFKAHFWPLRNKKLCFPVGKVDKERQ
jgi:hypothetical protein